jgi:2-succinyl-5-enolpyruvyl-6-hydroxy-3-cyclohexene-1-carboxylate synthase
VDGVIKIADLVFKRILAPETNSGCKHTKGAEYTNNFKPDFLVTIGRSIISKNLKLFLREYKPQAHWHIGEGMAGDPFQSLTKIVEIPPAIFLKEWLTKFATEPQRAQSKAKRQDGYFALLSKVQKEVCDDLDSKLEKAEFNYFSAVRKIIKNLPKNSLLHLGNSMPVRIANFIGIQDPTINVWCNRGTSGIDGVVSTAVGHAIAEPNRKHTLIIGDLSFFYDRNGLWLNHEFPNNLQIVILNDSGGGIFNMIPGPSDQGDLTHLFTTKHNRTAEPTAKEFGLEYWSVGSMDELEKVLEKIESGILEIFTDMKINTETFKRIATKGTEDTK